MNLGKALVKGAFLGFVVGSTFVSIGKNSTIFWKKIKLFADVSRLNEGKMFW